MNELATEAVSRNQAAGYHYFDPFTMRFFRSRVHDGYDFGPEGTLVLMSNQGPPAILKGRRHYYFIVVRPDGAAKSLSGDARYDIDNERSYWFSLAQARKQVERLRGEG